MDARWFKDRQKQVGVTAEHIAARMGRARSNVSHILTGKQVMSLDWAKAFAEVLQVDLATVLEKAGLAEPALVQPLRPGFAESDAAPWVGRGADDRRVPEMAAALGARPGVDIWRVRSASMAMAGYLPGDFMLVDTHQAERARPGDVVLAQIYNNSRGTAATVLRRFLPPVLMTAAAPTDEAAAHVVDGVNVLLRGRVVASWRLTGTDRKIQSD